MMPIIDVVVAVLRNTQNQVLIVQRPQDKELGGYWEFPGGKIDQGETPKEALQRELKEELNITCSLEHLNPLICFPSFSVQRKIIFSFYTLHEWQGEIILLEGQPRFLWIDIAQLGQFQMPEPNIQVYPLL
jgi:8-oxo-dGTP diphosphatase